MVMTDESSSDRAAVQAQYSAGAVLLHWAIALALVCELVLGFTMPHDISGFALIQLHKSVGITILMLTLVRLGWRVTNRPPPAVEPGFKGLLSKTVHVLLYGLMIGLPLTGWAMVSSDPVRIPTLLFGTIPWPHLPLQAGLNEAMENSHEILGWIAAALIVLHVAAALRHQVLLRDGLFRRMAPGGSVAAAWALTVSALALALATAWGAANSVPGSRDGRPVQQAASPGQGAPDEEGIAVSPSATPTAEASTPAVEAPDWAIAPGGRLGFTVSSDQGSYNGSFSSWSGEIKMNPEDPSTAEIRIAVDLSSASLGDATMDATLHGADFFAVSSSRQATWRSTSVTRTGTGRYSASGTLSLKGASRSQSIVFTLTGTGARRHVDGSGSIDRTAFGVGTGEAAQGVGNSVSLTFSFDATQREP